VYKANVDKTSFRLSCRILPTLYKVVERNLCKRGFHKMQSYHRVLKERSGFLRHSAYRLHLEEQHPRNNRSQTTLGCSVNRIFKRLLLSSPFREQRSSVAFYERTTLLTKYPQQPKVECELLRVFCAQI